MFSSRKDHPSKSASSTGSARATAAVAPGPSGQAARLYYERGGDIAISRNAWMYIAITLSAVLLVAVVALWQIAMRSSVETLLVSKQEGGRLVAESGNSNWRPDQDSTVYFLNNWAAETFEVNPATWEREVAKASRMTTGTATSQLRDLLGRPDFNPAALLAKTPGLVRTYDTIGVNFIKDDVALIRFRLTTRLPNGSKTESGTYAMTVNIARVPPQTRAQVLENPYGLYITSLNLTEESPSK